MGDRVDKSWQEKGLGGYPVEALLGTLNHYGVTVDEAAFRVLAKDKFPIAIGVTWAEAWKGTGKFKDFPFPAADELWRRWLKGTLAPNELVIAVLELLRALGVLQGKSAPWEVEAAFAAAEAMLPRLPPVGEARERFMSEVVAAMGKLQQPFDVAGELLAKEGKAPLARRFVELEEALFPVRAGVSRAIVDAVLGKGPESIAKLEELANDASRDPFARIAAVDALLHLKEPQRTSATLQQLMAQAVKDHDHELAGQSAQRSKAALDALPKGPLKEELMKKTVELIAAFDHHH